MTVRCEDLPLTDIVDGCLDPARVREVEGHLLGCAACRALVADLRTVRAAAFTLDRREPPADVLARVQARVAEDVRTRALAGGWPAGWLQTKWLAAAAILVVTTFAALANLWQPSAPEGDGTPVAVNDLVDSVQADLQAAEAHYEKAIRGLEQIARSDTDALDPQVAAVLKKNLQVVDQAIDESRAALRSQPASLTVQDGLFEAMRTKVMLLQQTVELINEMRKGNQAEAGRLMQDLSR